MSFIVIEGLDGSGKSTQLKKLINHCENQRIKYKYLHFPRPDSDIYGDLISQFLRGELGDINEVNPYLIALIYAGDRNDAKEMIHSWLSEGYLVIVDRYVFSNIAFQCAKLNDVQEIEKLSKWILHLEYEYFKIPKPDLNLFLDVPFAFTKNNLLRNRNGDDRSYLNGKEDIHEKDLSFQEKVRKMYLNEANNDGYLQIIDCSDKDGTIQPPEMIFDKIIDFLTSKNILK